MFFFTLIYDELPQQILTIERLFTFHARRTLYDNAVLFKAKFSQQPEGGHQCETNEFSIHKIQ